MLLPRFLWDSLTKGKYAAGFWQRLGFLPAVDFEDEKIVWIHCVSVGETNAARPLVKKILEDFPDCKIVVSTTTKTGQKLAQDVFKQTAALVFYFPFDWRFVVRRALRKIRPAAVLIVETELWFNFLREAKRQNVKIALVNGRISEKSFKNYKLIQGFMRRVLADLDLALMSETADAERLAELGCGADKIFVTGNVKFDLAVETTESELTKQLRQRFGFDSSRPLIVAASTHELEETVVLTAFARLRAENKSGNNSPSPRLLIVPRHPERFDAVAKLIEKSGFSFARRAAAEDQRDLNADVILLDSVGELRQVYPLAEIVFVGGSLIPHGGQNVLEPAAARKPIVTGFYTENFANIVKILLEKNALVQLPQTEIRRADFDFAALVLFESLRDLLGDNTARETLAANAFAVLQNNSGATAKTIELLKSVLNVEMQTESKDLNRETARNHTK